MPSTPVNLWCVVEGGGGQSMLGEQQRMNDRELPVGGSIQSFQGGEVDAGHAHQLIAMEI